MSSRRKSHRPQAASISHPILQTDGASAIGRIASPSSASPNIAVGSSSSLLSRRSPVIPSSTLPVSNHAGFYQMAHSPGAYGSGVTHSPGLASPSTSSHALSRLTPPPLQPLAPTPSLTNAAGGPSSSVLPGAGSSSLNIASLSRSPSSPSGDLLTEGSHGRAYNPALDPANERADYRIKVNSRDIELGAGSSSRPSASLSLRQASSGNQPRRPIAAPRQSWMLEQQSAIANYNSNGKQREEHGLDFDVHPTFRANSAYKGNVLVKVQGVEFFVHADILRFSSPFFESLLDGGWKESRLSWRSSLFESFDPEEAGDQAGMHVTQRPDGEAEPMTKPTEPIEDSTLSSKEDQSRDLSSSLEKTPVYINAAKRMQGSGGVRASFVTAYDDLDLPGMTIPEWPEELAAQLKRRSSETGIKGGSPAEKEATGAAGHKRDRSSASFLSASGSPKPDEETKEVARRRDETARLLEKNSGRASNEMDSRERHDSEPNIETKGTLISGNDERASSNRNREVRKSASEGNFPAAKMSQLLSSSGDEHAVCTDGESSGRRLEMLATPPISPPLRHKALSHEDDQETAGRKPGRTTKQSTKSRYHGLKAIIELHEESASIFQDFLLYIYPHLDVQITWLSCGSLLAFADKIGAPSLHRTCLEFLRASLAGKPIEAMRLAELHNLGDVYKEASRHVLDNWTAWEREDLELLSPETLLKLERRRSWFLERVLKLGLANPLRDYECHASCPDPGACAKGLQERWQAGYANSCRFSPPQPSGIWRYLRELDGQPPLPLSACNSAAKTWRELLFDRMFNLPSIPPSGRTVRQFLHIRLER